MRLLSWFKNCRRLRWDWFEFCLEERLLFLLLPLGILLSRSNSLRLWLYSWRSLLICRLKRRESSNNNGSIILLLRESVQMNMAELTYPNDCIHLGDKNGVW